MKILSPFVRYSSLLFFFLLTACGPLQETVNSYNENCKCRARNDAGECIDTPTAYKKARYPKPISGDIAKPAAGITLEIKDNRYKLVTGLLRKAKKPLLQPPKILRVLLLAFALWPACYSPQQGKLGSRINQHFVQAGGVAEEIIPERSMFRPLRFTKQAE